jgi:thymidylate synthase (FAD)
MHNPFTNRPPITQGAEEIINGYFPVLDHGFVALKDVMGSDDDIESAARTSYQQGTRQKSAQRGLLRYLMRNKHTTPFEMVELKFHVSMPIFIARQWIRHRTASVNEVSGRYSLLPMQFYTPAREDFKLQATDNKQGRGAETTDTLFAHAVERWGLNRQFAQEDYEWMNANDVARELARIDLPLSTYTNWIWKIDLKNLFHFLALRVHSHAQKEIQVYGEIMAGMVERIAPVAFEAWLDYEVLAENFSYQEMNLLRAMLVAREQRITPEVEEREVVIASKLPAYSGYGEQELKHFGITGREAKELYAKLQPKARPDFTLDLSKMKDGSFFEAAMAAAVPGAK